MALVPHQWHGHNSAKEGLQDTDGDDEDRAQAEDLLSVRQVLHLEPPRAADVSVGEFLTEQGMVPAQDQPTDGPLKGSEQQPSWPARSPTEGEDGGTSSRHRDVTLAHLFDHSDGLAKGLLPRESVLTGGLGQLEQFAHAPIEHGRLALGLVLGHAYSTKAAMNSSAGTRSRV